MSNRAPSGIYTLAKPPISLSLPIPHDTGIPPTRKELFRTEHHNTHHHHLQKQNDKDDLTSIVEEDEDEDDEDDDDDDEDEREMQRHHEDHREEDDDDEDDCDYGGNNHSGIPSMYHSTSKYIDIQPILAKRNSQNLTLSEQYPFLQYRIYAYGLDERDICVPKRGIKHYIISIPFSDLETVCKYRKVKSMHYFARSGLAVEMDEDRTVRSLYFLSKSKSRPEILNALPSSSSAVSVSLSSTMEDAPSHQHSQQHNKEPLQPLQPPLPSRTSTISTTTQEPIEFVFLVEKQEWPEILNALPSSSSAVSVSLSSIIEDAPLHQHSQQHNKEALQPLQPLQPPLPSQTSTISTTTQEPIYSFLLTFEPCSQETANTIDDIFESICFIKGGVDNLMEPEWPTEMEIHKDSILADLVMLVSMYMEKSGHELEHFENLFELYMRDDILHQSQQQKQQQQEEQQQKQPSSLNSTASADIHGHNLNVSTSHASHHPLASEPYKSQQLSIIPVAHNHVAPLATEHYQHHAPPLSHTPHQTPGETKVGSDSRGASTDVKGSGIFKRPVISSSLDLGAITVGIGSLDESETNKMAALAPVALGMPTPGTPKLFTLNLSELAEPMSPRVSRKHSFIPSKELLEHASIPESPRVKTTAVAEVAVVAPQVIIKSTAPTATVNTSTRRAMALQERLVTSGSSSLIIDRKSVNIMQASAEESTRNYTVHGGTLMAPGRQSSLDLELEEPRTPRKSSSATPTAVEHGTSIPAPLVQPSVAPVDFSGSSSLPSSIDSPLREPLRLSRQNSGSGTAIGSSSIPVVRLPVSARSPSSTSSTPTSQGNAVRGGSRLAPSPLSMRSKNIEDLGPLVQDIASNSPTAFEMAKVPPLRKPSLLATSLYTADMYDSESDESSNSVLSRSLSSRSSSMVSGHHTPANEHTSRNSSMFVSSPAFQYTPDVKPIPTMHSDADIWSNNRAPLELSHSFSGKDSLSRSFQDPKYLLVKSSMLKTPSMSKLNLAELKEGSVPAPTPDTDSGAGGSAEGGIKPTPFYTKEQMQEIASQMSVIRPYMLVGNEVCARNIDELEKNHVSHIVNLSAMSETNHYQDKFQYLAIRILDSEDEDLTSILMDICCFVDEAREQGSSCLIHCYQGVSRSCSAAIAYLMLREGMTFDAAYKLVVTCRPVAAPNAGFVDQLVRLETAYDAFDDMQVFRVSIHSERDPHYLVGHRVKDFPREGFDPRFVYLIMPAFGFVGDEYFIVIWKGAEAHAAQCYSRAEAIADQWILQNNIARKRSESGENAPLSYVDYLGSQGYAVTYPDHGKLFTSQGNEPAWLLDALGLHADYSTQRLPRYDHEAQCLEKEMSSL
eukprot:CAMPEP_0184706826 /NCGR_PEP_ID=MMETSP0313-20130426/36957_1 /TAXON_ID=2792 /ORGANISM="Porphyridium aerugineum, Strain SAG 1380-2" /LENGTH=1349 /DNA_ID=CAMNT_0027168393 /DNA_START=278 /DNA_END=4328 /DNA_ORIENTATION=-